MLLLLMMMMMMMMMLYDVDVDVDDVDVPCIHTSTSFSRMYQHCRKFKLQEAFEAPPC